MILTDAGPLVALLDEDDQHHAPGGGASSQWVMYRILRESPVDTDLDALKEVQP